MKYRIAIFHRTPVLIAKTQFLFTKDEAIKKCAQWQEESPENEYWIKDENAKRFDIEDMMIS